MPNGLKKSIYDYMERYHNITIPYLTELLNSKLQHIIYIVKHIEL